MLTLKNLRLSLGVAFLLIILSFQDLVYAQKPTPSDAEEIRQKMEKVINYIDSYNYAEKVSDAEHIVLIYLLSQQRVPTEEEFIILSMLKKTIGLRRSEALALVLQNKERKPDWKECRNFLNRVKTRDFHTTRYIAKIVRQLSTISDKDIIKKMTERSKIFDYGQRIGISSVQQQAVPNIQYNTYFGYLHAHSNLSDGNGSPYDAYTFARDVGELDFFALTDHGEYLDLWPWEHKWETLIDAAHKTYQPGSYVTLWGFEWSNPVLGHINILNTADYTNTVFVFSLEDVYEWIIARPESFARYNHPGDYDDFFMEFLHLDLYTPVVPQMVGIETWNGNDSFETFYYSGGWFSDYSFFDEGNQQGWYLGALGGQDNHNEDWGVHNDFRTAVLAEELTRESIIDAYRNRRFYATEDKDLYLDFRCNGYPMGSKLINMSRFFEVRIFDGSGDTFLDVLLYRNGDLIDSKLVYGNNIDISFEDSSPPGDDYYYVVVRQSDDNNNDGRNDEAISSPIWVSGIMTGEPEIEDTLDDFSKMYDYSPNLKLGTHHPEWFDGDSSRLRRTTSTQEWIVYKTKTDITSFEMITFFNPFAPMIGFTISMSSDGINFIDVTKTVTGTGGYWRRLVFEVQSIPSGMKYLKVTYKDTTSVNTPQIGSLKIFTLGEGTVN
jgi:hypothetical protein